MSAQFLPNFKTTFLIMGFTFIVLSLSLFGKGLMMSMAEFRVPQQMLSSPHYYDAILWVYVHMLVIGLLLIAIGYSVTETKKQKWISILLFLVTAVYTFLDFRSSDSAVGNGLYQGEASVIPAIISLITALLFLQLSIRLVIRRVNP